MENRKEKLRIKRHKKIRRGMFGTNDKPRLVVHRSLKNIHAQIIDDTKNSVLFSLSTLDKGIREKSPSGGNIKAAELFGQEFAKRAKEKGISRVVFDRGGYLYHGRVRAFAESLKKSGINF